MTAQCQEPLIILMAFRLAGPRQIRAIEDQARRRSVLEAAISVPDGKSHEDVSVERWRAAEESYLRLAEALQILGNPLHLRIDSAGNDEFVRNALSLELDALEITDLDGMIQ